jgi:26S proteasome regulatory subunit T4
MRPGRIDRKIEIPLPNEVARMEILKIHAGPIRKSGEIDYEAIVKLSEGFNGADLRNICTEAGMFAIRCVRDGLKCGWWPRVCADSPTLCVSAQI